MGQGGMARCSGIKETHSIEQCADPRLWPLLRGKAWQHHQQQGANDDEVGDHIKPVGIGTE